MDAEEKSTNIYDDLLNDDSPVIENAKDQVAENDHANTSLIDNSEIAAQINELKIQLKNIKSKDGPKKIKAPAKVKKPQI